MRTLDGFGDRQVDRLPDATLDESGHPRLGVPAQLAGQGAELGLRLGRALAALGLLRYDGCTPIRPATLRTENSGPSARSRSRRRRT